MTDRPTDQFERALKLGPLALLRLRAEFLLEHGDTGTIPLSQVERERLDHIAVNASLNDRAFLDSFDARLAEAFPDDDEGED
jgi:hypothetical protein